MLPPPTVHASAAAQVPVARQLRVQDIIEHQSIEMKSVALATPFQMAHIKDKAACVRGEGNDENNLLALSPAMHSMFDGNGYRNGRPRDGAPTVFISMCPYVGNPSRSGTRTPVLLSVECANKATYEYVSTLMESGSNRECLTYYCYVSVKNFRKFEAYIGWKYDRTMRANFGPRWRERARAGPY